MQFSLNPLNSDVVVLCLHLQATLITWSITYVIYSDLGHLSSSSDVQNGTINYMKLTLAVQEMHMRLIDIITSRFHYNLFDFLEISYKMFAYELTDVLKYLRKVIIPYI